jgi:hypothetical protein
MVRGNDIRERSMGVGACIRQKGTYDDLCGARVIGIVGLREEIGVQGNDIYEHWTEVDISVGERVIAEIEVQVNDIHEHLAEVDICVGARVIGTVGLREEIEVQGNDIHEHLAVVDVCVRQKGTCDGWCDMGEMSIDGHYEDSLFVKTDYPQPKSGAGDGVVGSGYSGGSRDLFHRSKVH